MTYLIMMNLGSYHDGCADRMSLCIASGTILYSTFVDPKVVPLLEYGFSLFVAYLVKCFTGVRMLAGLDRESAQGSSIKLCYDAVELVCSRI